MSDTLYNQDLQKWIEQTIEQLKNQQFESLDVEHLIKAIQVNVHLHLSKFSMRIFIISG